MNNMDTNLKLTQKKVSVDGMATISCIHEINELLKESMKEIQELIIVHTNLQEMDLTYYQLLVSVFQTGIKKRINIKIQDSPHGIINYFCQRFELDNIIK